jgi:hypothetical protein
MTMEKTLAAVAIAAFMAAAITVLPGFTPRVEDNQPTVTAKADRLAIAGNDCATQDWPKISTECLHGAGADRSVTNVRFVTVR